MELSCLEEVVACLGEALAPALGERRGEGLELGGLHIHAFKAGGFRVIISVEVLPKMSSGLSSE